MSLPILDEPVVPQALVHAWREARDDKARAQRAYAKFSLRRAYSPIKLLVAASWVLAGMLLSLGSLYAASAAPWHALGFETTRVLESPRWTRHRAVRVQPRVTAPTTGTTDVAPALGPSPVSEPALKPLGSASATAAASTPEQWQRAARGLREGDFAAANSALRALIAQTNGAEREAAQLALAQLLLSHGPTAEARQSLRDLQASASSDSVRQKAGELLLRREESAASQRSFEGRGETNQP